MVNALDAEIDTIIHGIFTEPDGSTMYRPEIADRIASQGVFVNPTLAGGNTRIVRMMEERLEAEGLTEEEQAELERMRGVGEIRLDHFARMRDAGVTMVCGSDSAWGHYKMGGFQHEIEAHVEAGMSNMEAILSATSDSAESCHVDDAVGTLEPGKQADILVVDGDPSQDIAALWNVADVYLNGQLVDRSNLV